MPKKLIRDKIPEIIKNQGRNPVFYTADENEYKNELFKKLLEETNEVLEEKMNKEKLIEELWDLLEVVEAIAKLEKIDMQEILKIKEQKAKTNWRFEERFILEM